MNQTEKYNSIQSDIETLRRVIRTCEPVYKQAFENLVGALNEAREALSNSIMLPSYSESSAQFNAAWPELHKAGDKGGWREVATKAWDMSRDALKRDAPDEKIDIAFASQGKEPDWEAYDKAESAQSLEVAWESVCNSGYSDGDRELFTKAWHMSRQAWGKYDAPAEPDASPNLEPYRLNMARELFDEWLGEAKQVDVHKIYAIVNAAVYAASHFTLEISKLDKLPR